MDDGQINSQLAVSADQPLGGVWALQQHRKLVSSQEIAFEGVENRPQSGLDFLLRDATPIETSLTFWLQVNLAAKRLTDVVIAFAAITFLFPLLVLVALAIKLDSRGPVLFLQEREGLNGRAFRIFKFRSMVDKLGDASGIRHTVSGDQRLTKLGKFLRKTSIDELPQLFNIVLGDMSLVGPRPHVYDMRAGGQRYCDLVPYYGMRHAMKPGLTGWAQANGLRGDASDPDVAIRRIDHDVAYIQNFSWWLDVRCIGMTIKNEFLTGSGA